MRKRTTMALIAGMVLILALGIIAMTAFLPQGQMRQASDLSPSSDNKGKNFTLNLSENLGLKGNT
jgi:hypothetical protein